MTAQQAHALKLQSSLFAEACAMLEYAKNKPPLELEAQIARVAAERNKLYNMLDEATEE